MKIQNSRCLILNADFTPLAIINWKRAVVWAIKHELNNNVGIEIIDFYKEDYILGTNNKKFPIPAVARTSKYFRINNYSVNFSRKNLFIRDNYSCQYCGKTFDMNQLTYDHVVPKSLWKNECSTPTSWTNIVTACVDCNRKKGNRTPKQANMPLKNFPEAPKKNIKYLPIAYHLFKIREDIPQEWKTYLPEAYL